MKILVTGSNGLLGMSLKKILGSDHIYHTRNDCDLSNYESTYSYLSKLKNDFNIDTIIHCAAKVGGVLNNINNNDNFFDENLKINSNVINSAHILGIENFVNILSTCIFPSIPNSYPLTADQIDIGPPHNSNSGYSYAKRLSGYQTKIIRQFTNKNWISVVPTNIYGPNDNFNLENSHVIPALIHKAYLAKKNNDNFTVWGDGKTLRQFIYVDDLSNLIIWVLKNWNSEIPFMATDNNEIQLLEIIKIICDKFEIPNEKIVFDLSRPSGQYRKPAKSDIPFDIKLTPIECGLTKTIDWFTLNYNILKK
jgi:GDP-L-fucose synthase